MPNISKQTLKSFLGDKSFITDIDNVAGLEDAIAQADNIVYQKTSIQIPNSVEGAIPLLQFCSHAIAIYIISMRQQLKEEEIKRRDELYSKAMDLLEQISSGKMDVYDKNGNIVSVNNSQVSTFYIKDTDRSERL